MLHELPSPHEFAVLAGTSRALGSIDRERMRLFSGALRAGSVVAVADRGIVAAYRTAMELGDSAAISGLLQQHLPAGSGGQLGLPVQAGAVGSAVVFTTCPLTVLEHVIGPADRRQLAPVWPSVRSTTDVVDICPATLELVAEGGGRQVTVQQLRLTLSTTVQHLVQTLAGAACIALDDGGDALLQVCRAVGYCVFC